MAHSAAVPMLETGSPARSAKNLGSRVDHANGPRGKARDNGAREGLDSLCLGTGNRPGGSTTCAAVRDSTSVLETSSVGFSYKPPTASRFNSEKSID
jgi:hypothetical protein